MKPHLIRSEATSKRGKEKSNDYYSLKEMMEKFKISKRTVFRRCEQFGIPQIIEGRKNFLGRRPDVDVHFAELLVQYDLKDWYNAQQIEGHIRHEMCCTQEVCPSS